MNKVKRVMEKLRQACGAAWQGFAPGLLTAFFLGVSSEPGFRALVCALAAASFLAGCCAVLCKGRLFLLVSICGTALTVFAALVRHVIPLSGHWAMGGKYFELQAGPASGAVSSAFVVAAAAFVIRALREQYLPPRPPAEGTHEKREGETVRLPQRRAVREAEVTFEELERLLKE
jgi:hypothetical protein